MTKVVVVSFSFVRGGAAIAAEKFTNILKQDDDFEVIKISQDGSFFRQILKRCASYFLSLLQINSNKIKHSLNLFSFQPLIKCFSECGEAVFHFHWINNDTLSVFDFKKIPSGSIITLHDEWLYCGAEHYYSVIDNSLDFIDGYQLFKEKSFGVHWNYFLWKIKFKALSNRYDVIFTVPSVWMLERAKASRMLKNLDVRLLPNVVDGDFFYPANTVDIERFRNKIEVSDGELILCFGAIKAKSNFYKGIHLLMSALAILASDKKGEWVRKIKVVNFGGENSGHEQHFGFSFYSLGHVSSVKELSLIYSSADFVVVPSLLESFGQVAAESLLCQTPVVSYDTSGLRDIVKEGETGVMATPYNEYDLADKIKQMSLLPRQERLKMGRKGREDMISRFSTDAVSSQYSKIIENAVALKKEAL